ncbi:caspase domain-containing protein [Myxococcota bacterium]
MRVEAAWTLVVVAALAPTDAKSTEHAGIRRFALVIGSNDGGPDRVKLRYAHSDAHAFAEVLTQLGGVAPEDQHLLLEPSRTQIETTLAQLGAELDDRGEQADRTELVVYFSGHSDEEGLLLAGEHFSYRDLRHTLTTFAVDVRIGILDSCASGALTRAKGGKRRPPFLLDESTDVSGHAFLTSSSADEAAQESDAIGASFFTHYLISGLRGGADTTGDGRVTLNEAYQFAFAETLARTEKTRSGAQHPSYDIQLAGSGDLVLTDLRVTSAGLVLGEPLVGRLYVHDDQERLVAELHKAAGRRVEIGLQPGSYRLTMRQGDDVMESRMVIAPGARQTMTGAHFERVEQEETVARGPHALSPGPPAAARVELPIERVPVRLALLPRLRPDHRVSADVSLGLLFSNATEVGGFAFAFAANTTEERAHGLLLTLGVNYVGTDLEGFGLALGSNIVKGTGQGPQVAMGFNTTGDDVDFGQLALGFNLAGGSLNGFQAAIGFNVTDSDTRYAQLAGGFNIAGGNLLGLQLAPGFNITGEQVRGGQGSVGFNIAGGDLWGAQAAVGLNVTGGQVRGGQVAVLNIAGDISGAQIGILNIANHVKGVQVGLINIAEDIEGVPIGPINWVQKGQRHFDYWASPQELVNLDFRFGSRNVYTIVTAGFSSPEEEERWYVALGLGASVPLDPFSLNFDLSAGVTRKGFKPRSIRNVRAQLRAFLSYKIFDRLGVFVGGSLNTFAGFDGSDIVLEHVPQIVHSDPENVVRVWPSFFGGIQI